MRLTVDLPWLTYPRRVATMLVVMLLLLAAALPASAAPPQGVSGEVTVVNEPDDPVPVTGDVTATVVNDATNPVPVSAAQSGSWTVGLEPDDAIKLTDIADATSGLSYDENGNLNVSVSNSSTGPIAGHAGIEGPSVADGLHFVLPPNTHRAHPVQEGFLMTGLSASAGQPINILVLTPGGTGLYWIPVPGGGAVYHDFSVPVEVRGGTIEVWCRSSSSDCEYIIGVIGYVPEKPD